MIDHTKVTTMPALDSSQLRAMRASSSDASAMPMSPSTEARGWPTEANACTYAFLRGSGAVVGAFVKAEEYVFKLVHTCVGKQQGWVVVWHERGGADDGVAFRFEKFQEFLA